MKTINRFIFSLLLMTVAAGSAYSQSCSECRYITPIFDSVTVSTVKFGQGMNIDGVNQELFMDVYQPFGDTMSNRPVAIFAFGGGFVQGARDDWYVVEVCRHLAKAGYVAVSPDYRIGIDATEILQLRHMRIFFRPMQDMRAAIQYLKADFSELGNNYDIDTNRIILGGASAGAISALMTSYCDKPAEIDEMGNLNALDDLGGFYSTTGLYPNYSWRHAATLNVAGALINANWIEAGDVPTVAAHGNADAVVPYAYGPLGGINLGGIFDLQGSYVVDSIAKSKGVCSYLYTMEGQDHPSESMGIPYIMSVVYRLMLRMHAVVNDRSFCCALNLETNPADTARYNAAFPHVTISSQISNDNGNAQMRWCSLPCNLTSTDASVQFTPDTNWQYMASYAYEGGCEDVGFVILKNDSGYTSVKSNKALAKNNFSIYPQPSSGKFIVALKETTAEIIKTEIADITGRVVYVQEFIPANDRLMIDPEHLSSGSYLLKISAAGETWKPQKLIVAK